MTLIQAPLPELFISAQDKKKIPVLLPGLCETVYTADDLTGELGQGWQPCVVYNIIRNAVKLTML